MDESRRRKAARYTSLSKRASLPRGISRRISRLFLIGGTDEPGEILVPRHEISRLEPQIIRAERAAINYVSRKRAALLHPVRALAILFTPLHAQKGPPEYESLEIYSTANDLSRIPSNLLISFR